MLPAQTLANPVHRLNHARALPRPRKITPNPPDNQHPSAPVRTPLRYPRTFARLPARAFTAIASERVSNNLAHSSRTMSQPVSQPATKIFISYRRDDSGGGSAPPFRQSQHPLWQRSNLHGHRTD